MTKKQYPKRSYHPCSDHFQSDEISEDVWMSGVDRMKYALGQMKAKEHCAILKEEKLKKTAKAKP
jgi:hypothetical protein